MSTLLNIASESLTGLSVIGVIAGAWIAGELYERWFG